MIVVSEWFCYIMQDDASPHTAKKTIRALRSVFGELNPDDRTIRKGVWQLKSPGLNPCNF
jgi:hypothetical protein